MRVFKQLVALVLFALVVLGSVCGFGYLAAVAVGAVDVNAQLVGVIALLTVIGAALISGGYAGILIKAQQIDRDESAPL